MTVEALRARFMAEGLERPDLDADPFVQFEKWFGQATEAQIPEANAMSLATVNDRGQPSLRTVLLKTFDARGFVFFTNYDSRKSREMAVNPRVALLFAWVGLGRQVKIIGDAARISNAESLAYFATRPRGSQIGAWASPQSHVIHSRALLDAKVDEIKRKFREGRIPLPSFWGGYRVTPRAIEFWQARENRLHDRFLYSRQADTDWSIERLAP